MSIRIGGSCIGRYSLNIEGVTCGEYRILQNNEHKMFWPEVEKAIKNHIYAIVNIDTYITGGRWRPQNQELRDFVISVKNQLKKIGANKTNCRFTYDNESDEYTDFLSYMNGVRVVHDALAGEFDLGAGNFRTQRTDFYTSLAKVYKEKYYEVFDVHFQDGLNNENEIIGFATWLNSLKKTYGIKRIAVTEGNNFYNVSTPAGHNLLKTQIIYAENAGCEDFCFVYANWQHNGEESDQNMAYNWNSQQVSPYWPDMKNFINNKKPIVNGDDEMKLDKIYKKGSRGIGVKFIQMVVNEYMKTNLVIDGIWGTKTEEGVKAFQEANGLAVDGIVGPATFPAMIEAYPKLWDKVEYLYAIGG